MEETKKDGKVNDAELENVAGGSEEYMMDAWKEGRDYCLGCFYKCCECGSTSSTYYREKVNVKRGYDEYRDCKCYSCGKMRGTINTADKGFLR